MNLSKEEAAIRAREVVLDTGCNWTDAAAKVLEGARLSAEDRQHLLAVGLAQYARSSLNRRTTSRSSSSVPTAEELLEPLEGFLALTRIFEVGDTRKRFIDCDALELGLIAEHLKKTRHGYTRSIDFVLDVKAECERLDCRVADLPILGVLEQRAPW